MFEGFPSGPNDEDDDYVPSPLQWWERVLIVSGMSFFIVGVLTLLKSCSENKCPF